MNDLLLKHHMRIYGDTLETLAEALGLHPHTLYMKTRGDKQQFTQREIRAIMERYNLTPQQLVEVFFIQFR